jgi:hypothetical protein
LQASVAADNALLANDRGKTDSFGKSSANVSDAHSRAAAAMHNALKLTLPLRNGFE